jgi:hypothetical protein
MPDTLARRTVDHDAKPGPLTRCQICGSSHLRLIIDLGHQPPCDSLLTAEQLCEPEVTYPLRFMQCEECTLAQLDYVVPAEKVYPASYPYKAGISWPVVAAHQQMASALLARFGKGFVVDVGSNDGTLLKQFQALGCEVQGVEPTDVADFAIADGVPTIKAPFNEAVARHRMGQVKADLITFTNVFAHMGDLGEVMRGVQALLAPKGVLVVENHYLLDVLERNQFDTIYHEHIRTYSLKSIETLFHQYGMEVFDVDRVPRYGGNIRVYAARLGSHRVTANVCKVLAIERERGLGSAREWTKFRMSVYEARDEFMSWLHSVGGVSIAGCSAPGRASTLLNFYGVTPDLLPYTGELADSLKLGKYLPGCHIPVVPNARIINEEPAQVVLLAWHYGAEVAARLRKEGVRSKLMTPLPYFGELQ